MSTNSKSDRPKVIVQANTATTVEIIIESEHGIIRLLAGNEELLVQTNLKVRVEP